MEEPFSVIHFYTFINFNIILTNCIHAAEQDVFKSQKKGKWHTDDLTPVNCIII